MKRVFTTILLGISLSVFAQTEQAYKPLSDNIEKLSSLKLKIDLAKEADINALEGKHKKEIAEIYTDRSEELIFKLENNHFIFGTDLNTLIDEIFEEVKAKNTDLELDRIKLFISKYPWPNAQCIGEGSIIINLGLIEKLENRSQLAFVICHEIAHYHHNHVNVAIKERVTYLNSNSFQKDVNEISKTEYGSYEKAEKLLRNLIYDNRKHSRLHETQADLFAIRAMSKTKYNTQEAIRCLEILDSIDDESPVTVDLKTMFDSEEIPFKDSWLHSPRTNLFSIEIKDEDWDEDQLKTHPDCQKRIKNLQEKFRIEKKESIIEKDEVFEELILLSRYEIIESLYQFQEYGTCFYRTVYLLQDYPNDAYLHAMLSKCLYYIYQAQKRHELSKYVDQPRDSYEESFRTVLSFLNNMRLSEKAKVAFYYLMKNEAQYKENEDFLFALIACSKLMEKDAIAKQYIENYKDKFPAGRFVEEIELL